MSDVNRKVSSSFVLAGEEIASMFRSDAPRMTESELALSLLQLRTPEMDMLRQFLEPVIREELGRRLTVASFTHIAG